MTEIEVIQVEELAVSQRRANLLLGFGPESKWLEDPRCPIARCDVRKPGDTKPLWRWRVATLQAFLASREVLPGASNPQDTQ